METNENEASTIRIITDINKLCRTCLSEKSEKDLQSLFENSLDLLLLRLAAIKVRSSAITYYVTNLTGVRTAQVVKNDGLPEFMCNDCVMHLNVATNFKEQCQKSESQLREALSLYVVPTDDDNDKKGDVKLSEESTKSEGNKSTRGSNLRLSRVSNTCYTLLFILINE